MKLTRVELKINAVHQSTEAGQHSNERHLSKERFDKEVFFGGGHLSKKVLNRRNTVNRDKI